MDMELWNRQFREAMASFFVVGYDSAPQYRRIEAAADTGSRYVVYAVGADKKRDGADWLIVLRQPWEAMYEFNTGTFVDYRYWDEKIGHGHVRHGGDTAAVLECMRRLIGITFEEPK